MKFRAHLENNVTSETITIKKVIDGINSKNPEQWEKRTYYSLKYLTPMYAKPNCQKIRPHFVFKKGLGGNEKSGGGESLEHELAKEIIAKNSFLTVKIGNVQDTLYFSQVIIEQRFNKGERSADLYVQIKNQNKFDYTVGKGLVIEIHRSNKVTKIKRQFYRNLNIASIEIKIDKFNKAENDIYFIQNELEKTLKTSIRAESLHDPFWKEHKLKREKFEKWRKEELRKERFQKLEKERLKLAKIEPKPTIKKHEEPITIQNERKITQKKTSIFRQLFNWIKNK